MRTTMNTMRKTVTHWQIHNRLLAMMALALVTASCNRGEGTVPVHASATLPECTITARQSGTDVLVTVTVANHSPTAYPLLLWNLPKDGELTSVLFEVRRDGGAIEYRGRMVKRAVSSDSYVWIPSGRSMSTDVLLLQGYDVSRPGQYSITYRASNQRPDSSEIDTLSSNSVVVSKP